MDPGPTRITYTLTPKGGALADAVEAITAWAYAWNETALPTPPHRRRRPDHRTSSPIGLQTGCHDTPVAGFAGRNGAHGDPAGLTVLLDLGRYSCLR